MCWCELGAAALFSVKRPVQALEALEHSASSSSLAELICTRVVTMLRFETVRCKKWVALGQRCRRCSTFICSSTHEMDVLYALVGRVCAPSWPSTTFGVTNSVANELLSQIHKSPRGKERYFVKSPPTFSTIANQRQKGNASSHVFCHNFLLNFCANREETLTQTHMQSHSFFLPMSCQSQLSLLNLFLCVWNIALVNWARPT